MLSTSRLARVAACAVAVASLTVLMGASAASASNSTSFGFNARGIGRAGTGFRHDHRWWCLRSVIGLRPLRRWLPVHHRREPGTAHRLPRRRRRPLGRRTLLSSTGFKCTSSANEVGKTATTDEHTAVMLADFYRAGNGNDESFTAKMFVSDHDLAPDLDGVQNVWIQNVGCATAIVHFSS